MGTVEDNRFADASPVVNLRVDVEGGKSAEISSQGMYGSHRPQKSATSLMRA